MALKITDSTRNGEYRLEVETDDLYSFQMLRTLAWFCRDRVEVVRCKDCDYWNKSFVNGKGFRICPASGMDITENDFCSYGERRDSNG